MLEEELTKTQTLGVVEKTVMAKKILYQMQPQSSIKSTFQSVYVVVYHILYTKD